MVQLTDELVERLDREAQKAGVSRSALIRDAIEELLASSRETLLSEQIVAGYKRSPQGEPDAWGSSEQLADRSAVEVLTRVDSEEEAPW